MTELVVTRGLPASGKSTWAKAWVAADPSTRLRVNRDDIRFMLYGSYWGSSVDENEVTRVEEAIVKNALAAGKSVVVDATYLRAAHVKKWARMHPITVQDFPITLVAAVGRDYARQLDGDRFVGAAVIKELAWRYHIPADGTLPTLDLSDVQTFEHKPYVPGKIPAYSFDIDGTLAHMVERGPYDTSKYDTDAPDMPMFTLITDLIEGCNRGTQFIGLSGRSAEFGEVTKNWLARQYGVRLDELFMRATGDLRNDAIVKSELVDEHISGVYDVIMHFDDRNRVVDALRAKGMKVAQVEPGDF